MKQVIGSLAFLFFSLTGFSQTSIKLEEVPKHTGDSVSVCGKVAGGRFLEQLENSPTFLTLGAPYPNQLLTLVIGKELRGQFEKVPEEMYLDKEVCVAGKIIIARERPQLVIYKKEQLTVK